MGEYLRENGYIVKVFNLVEMDHSDSWNCLGEVGSSELMAQTFADIVLQNTSGDSKDAFWYNAELNLLKALVLYVALEMPPEKRNIATVYDLLYTQTEKGLSDMMASISHEHANQYTGELLPPSPASAPYAIFRQSSETVRTSVIIGLGSKLAVLQAQQVRNITSYNEIDLELPGKQKCAYFCIVSDQDSTYDFLSSLFFSFLFIRLIRYADAYCEGGMLHPKVKFILDEFPNCCLIPDFTKKCSILAELKPTIEYDDGVSSGTLSLDHSTLKTEAAGYKRSSYTVTATKNYTGLDRNDSSYIDKTVEKNGRTLSLSNVTWSVESTALVGDELVPATYSAVATYSGSASSTVATGYITTAEYKGTVVSSGISSILYTVTYLGTKIEPTKAEPTFKGAVLVISIIGGTALLAALLFLGLTLRKNTTVYKATGKGNEYEKCGRLHLKAKNPELRIDRLKDIPEGVIAIEVDQAVAKKLFGQTIAIHCYDNTVEHTVGTVNGQYWFKVDIGTQEGEPDTEEEPV